MDEEVAAFLATECSQTTMERRREKVLSRLAHMGLLTTDRIIVKLVFQKVPVELTVTSMEQERMLLNTRDLEWWNSSSGALTLGGRVHKSVNAVNSSLGALTLGEEFTRVYMLLRS